MARCIRRRSETARLNNSYQAPRRNITHPILAPAMQCKQCFTLTGDSPGNGIFLGEYRQARYGALYLTASWKRPVEQQLPGVEAGHYAPESHLRLDCALRCATLRVEKRSTWWHRLGACR